MEADPLKHLTVTNPTVEDPTLNTDVSTLPFLRNKLAILLPFPRLTAPTTLLSLKVKAWSLTSQIRSFPTVVQVKVASDTLGQSTLCDKEE